MKTFQFAIFTNKNPQTVIIGQNLRKKLLNLNFKENFANPELVFVIGGDGTFLKAVNHFNNILDTIKFVNFKQGKISFYHNFLVSEIDDVIENLIKKEQEKLIIQESDLLEVFFNNQVKYAVNEAKLLNFSETLKCKVFINNELLQIFKGSGIIVSTKNGSTGLMKSAHGAVILSKLKLMEYQEVFPVDNKLYHSLRAPVILDKSQELTLILDQYQKIENNIKLVVDTFTFHDKLIKEVKFKISNKSVKIISYKNKDDLIINKLNKTFINFENEFN